MLPIIQRISSIPWVVYCIAGIRHIWQWRLIFISRRVPPSPFGTRPLTDQERKKKANDFIEAIDTDAVRALGSKSNRGLSCNIRCRQEGGFNVCFVLDFPDGSTRLVRLPIEPAVCDVWGKVRSEVYTMQYLQDHTNIPIPRVYAYGRSRLLRDTSARQVFLIMDYVDGQSLTKKMLRDSSEENRRRFLGEIVDMFAQLRGLEFPRGGSLMPKATGGIWSRLWMLVFPREEYFTPQSTVGVKSGPKIVGAYSMRQNELKVDGYNAPRFTATTAKEFLEEQYRLLRYTWRSPCQDLGRVEAEREEFALHVLSMEKALKTFGLEADSSGDTFYLSHPDLRVANILVDDELHVCGVIDWEFSVTVPRHAFLPPSWITGHSTGALGSEIDIASEFMSVLSSRIQLSSNHAKLAQDWDFRDHFRLPMAYILLDPSDLVFLFYRCIYPRLYSDSRDKVVPDFFQRPANKEVQALVEQRLHVSEQYTQYLKDNNLFDDTRKAEWQKALAWVAETKEKLQQLSEWSDKTRDELIRMEEERTVQQGRV